MEETGKPMRGRFGKKAAKKAPAKKTVAKKAPAKKVAKKKTSTKKTAAKKATKKTVAKKTITADDDAVLTNHRVRTQSSRKAGLPSGTSHAEAEVAAPTRALLFTGRHHRCARLGARAFVAP